MLSNAQQPALYKSITENCWTTTMARKHCKSTEYSPCTCEHTCGPDCLNVVTSVECDDELCRNGPHCGNCQVQNKNMAAVVVMAPDNTGGKGWGLTTTNRLCAEEYLMEYVGEVITAKENAHRTTIQLHKNPYDNSTYSAHLQRDLVIDARQQGNMARYINHSCNPNCELRKREVKGMPCAIVVTSRAVAAGDELLLNYDLSTLESSHFQCLCGAPCCRGTMAGTSSSSGTMSANQDKLRIEVRTDGSFEVLHELNDTPFGGKGHRFKVPLAPE
jgi:hypothetical protein